MSRSLVLRNSVAFLVIVTGAGGCATSTRPEPASAPVAAEVVTNAACVSDVDSALAVMSRDYAGYRDNASARPAALAAVVDSARRDARRATDGANCLVAIRRLLAFFPDHHLQVGDRNPPPAQPTDTAARASRPVEPPRRPSVQWLDDSTALLRIPSFGTSWKPVIDSVIANDRARLLATPYLIIDVRRNGGGWTEGYASIIPLIYTGPIRMPGAEAWASAGNMQAARDMIASPQTPEAMKAHGRKVLERMEANPGTYVAFAEDSEKRLDTVFPMPKRVAILADKGCLSTCESFLLEATQSTKVTVLGTENTGGFLDYGNLRRIDLPSGERRLFMPMTRSRRLPAMPLDAIGLAPDVRIPKGEADAIEFARRFLRTGRGPT